jgi:hypothetical protein
MDASRSTDASPCAVGFIGDLGDPWVAAIADALAACRTVHRVDHAGPLPAWPFDGGAAPRAVVIHRHKLGPADASRLEEWRSLNADRAPRLFLCVSPYVRYEELERWSGLAELVIAEGTAADVLPGRLARRLDGQGRRPCPGTLPLRIEIAGGGDELCRALVDACVHAGYTARQVDEQEIGGSPRPRPRDRSGSAAERVLTIWEVPVLEPGWPPRLQWRVHRTGPVIALAGFADRAIVTRARQAGAVACLELPCDIDDLIDVVDRTVSTTPADSWPIPARVEPPHVLPARRRNARRHGGLVATSHWPDRGPLPTIPYRAGSGRGTEPPPAEDPVVSL